MKTSRVPKIIIASISVLCSIIIVLVIAYQACVKTIMFIDWDGTILSEQKVLYQKPATEPSIPQREGYTFIGWDTDIRSVTEDITIPAQYEKNTYTVTFLDWDGNILDMQSVLYEEDAVAPEAPERMGYTFTNWDGNYTDITEDTEIHAEYEIIHYTNELKQPENGTAEVSVEGPTYGEEVALTVKPATGYTYGTIKAVADDGTTIELTKTTDGTYSFTQPAQAISIEVSFSKIQEKKETSCSYCGGADHSTGHCTTKSIASGAVGRWVIPDVGVNVACYASSEQSVCDRKDSACYFTLGSQKVIGDHWNQGFGAIKKCVVGTKAYMDTKDGKQWYICTGVIPDGHNTGSALTDADYNPLTEANPGGITCYTCNGNWKNVTIVLFSKI